jgi:hypothetical protein
MSDKRGRGKKAINTFSAVNASSGHVATVNTHSQESKVLDTKRSVLRKKLQPLCAQSAERLPEALV